MTAQLKVKKYLSLKIASMVAVSFGFSMLICMALSGLYFILYSKPILAMLPLAFLPPETHRVFIALGVMLLLFGLTMFFAVYCVAELLDSARDAMRNLSLISQVAQDYYFKQNTEYTKPAAPKPLPPPPPGAGKEKV